MNGDGKLELVIANRTNLAVLLGNGDGTFRTPVTYPLDGGTFSTGLALADFNNGAVDVGS